MASGIDLFFTGLILICLDGESGCTVRMKDYPHTAFALNASWPEWTCGRNSKEVTEFLLEYKTGSFIQNFPLVKSCGSDGDYVQCPLRQQSVCVEVTGAGDCPKYKSFDPKYALRLDMIDTRITDIDESLLSADEYVATRIHFPHGAISSGSLWPDDDRPVVWYPSRIQGDVASIPWTLSDRLKIHYANCYHLRITNCRGRTLIELRGGASVRSWEVVLRNNAKPDGPYFAEREGWDYTTYLLWYYRLAIWKGGACPDYRRAADGATVLRCERESEKDPCAEVASPRDTVYWPAVLAPKPRKEGDAQVEPGGIDE